MITFLPPQFLSLAAKKARAADGRLQRLLPQSVFVHGGGNSSIEKTFALIFLLFSSPPPTPRLFLPLSRV
jgi:hypothetical protein